MCTMHDERRRRVEGREAWARVASERGGRQLAADEESRRVVCREQARCVRAVGHEPNAITMPSTVESWANQAVRGLIMRYGRYWRGVRNVRERASRANLMRVAEEDGVVELWPRAG